jgi:predicted lipoprotein with Yx(FWY)xxD motif
MWKIVSIVLLSLVAFAGVAFAAQYNYNSPTTPQPTQPPNQSTQGSVYTVNVAVAMVQGKREQILTDARGMALYYLKSDAPARTTCTGKCAKLWPPLLSASTPTHAPALPGKFSVVTNANGSQVSYNGHLLYTYSEDTTRGKAAGNGLYGKWFVAKPGL